MKNRFRKDSIGKTSNGSDFNPFRKSRVRRELDEEYDSPNISSEEDGKIISLIFVLVGRNERRKTKDSKHKKNK